MIDLSKTQTSARDHGVIARALASARSAQTKWREISVTQRAEIIGRLRHALAENSDALAESVAQTTGRPASEKIVSELLPLIEAAHWLQTEAPEILKTRYEGRRGRPRWLGGVTLEISRRPFGVVLVVAPRNYPLFLPAVNALHALAAGNAVLLKPAPNCTATIARFREIVLSVGLDAALFQILPENVEAAVDAVHAGVDLVVFTGSSTHGRELLQHLALHNTPSIMELSGADNVFVRADADLARAAGAIAFALDLNGGNTCIVPHRVYVHASASRELRARLAQLGAAIPLHEVASDEEAVALVAHDEYGLGTSIFSTDEKAARALAKKLPTGFVTINDLIVPTSDPRFPFGGVRASGFGTTRGREGLLALTIPHALAISRAKRLRHLDPLPRNPREIFLALVSLLHGRSWRKRGRAFFKLMKAARKNRQPTRS
ncbi:MAG: aldehyde dehydrogenase family protein [Verrucomicrobiota bacterium]|nr:aldehyde dehydrogenase family protein [Verrucomicrobiota bacterium]